MAFFSSSWEKWVILHFCPSEIFLLTVNTLLTKHVSSRRLNNSLIDVFMDLHFVTIHSNAEKIFSRRIYSHLHLTRGQERMFICTYEWMVKFFLQFLASGFIYQTTRILFLKMNCLSLNIVPWLPFVNFHFSWMNLHNYSVRQINLQVSNHYSSFKFIYYSVRRIKLQGWMELVRKTLACYHACQK